MHECLKFFRLNGEFKKRYDPVEVFQYNYWLYVCTGFWKYEPSARWKSVLYKWYRSSIILFYAGSMTLFIVDAVQVRQDLNKLSFNMSSSVLVFMKVTEMGLLSQLRENVIQMYDKLDNHLYVDTVGCSSDDKGIFKEKAKITLRITVMFYGLLAIGLPLRVVADTALGTKAYLIPMPFTDILQPYYPYLYAQQVFACFHFMASTLAFDLLQFTLLLRFLAHYEILEKNILKIKALQLSTYENCLQNPIRGGRRIKITATWCACRGSSDKQNGGRCGQERVSRLLKQNIIHHQNLLVEVKNFSDTYSRPLLVQVCGMLILIGILILQLLFMSDELSGLLFIQQTIYAVTAVLNILYLSSFGSELTSKSASIANALYDIPWYDMSTNNKKTVHVALQRLMRGPKLRGGNMVSIDRSLCVKFLQFSYNMVTLLRQRV